MATNYNFTKERNFINFCIEGETVPYVFDINTGILYGKSGKPLENFPKGFLTWVRNMSIPSHNTVGLMRYYSHYGYDDGYNRWEMVNPASLRRMSNYFNLVDRLEALGYSMNTDSDYHTYKPLYLDFVNDNFKIFAKEVRENPRITLKEFYDKYSFIFFKEKIKNQYQLNDTQLMSIYNNKARFNSNQIPLVAYYISHGLWTFYFLRDDYSNNYSSLNDSPMYNHIKEYFNMCEQLGVEPEKDFFKHSVAVFKDYMTFKKKIDLEKLNDYANRLSWLNGFSAYGLEVIVPNTPQMFLDEANQQSNCVYSYYLQRVIDGETNVIFIRKRDSLDKSHITCEFTSKGTINQYLGKHNSTITRSDVTEMNFKIALMDYLKKHL